MNIKHLIAGAIASIAVSTSAHAALVSPTTSVTAGFDVSSPSQINAYAYFCNLVCDGPGTSDPDKLAAGAQFQILFGTSAGADDLGSDLFTNSLIDAAFNVTVPILIDLPGGLSTIYLTVVYVDDVFVVEELGLAVDGNVPLLANARELAVGDVPLPAALPLFFAGIAGFGAAMRRKRATA